MVHYNNLINALCDDIKRIVDEEYKNFPIDKYKDRNKIKKKKKNDNLISVLYFDEMGFTEISLNNLLKVIHSLLKNNENEDSKKIAFVIFK